MSTFTSFAGRVLFATIFLLAAFQKLSEFGPDGGPAAKAVEPKVALFTSHIEKLFNFSIPNIDVKYLLILAIALEGFGAILFIAGSHLGAYFLMLFLLGTTPIMHDFYNFSPTSVEFQGEFIHFLKNLALFGALIFFLGSKPVVKLVVKKDKVKSKKN